MATKQKKEPRTPISERIIAGKFRVKKIVTVPLLKLKPNGPPYYLRFESSMFIGREMKQDDKKAKMEPATLLHCLDLQKEQGHQECQIIVPAVLRSELEENYPEGAYVGKSFELTVTREKDSEGNMKRYNHIGLTEIEVME